MDNINLEIYLPAPIDEESIIDCTGLKPAEKSKHYYDLLNEFNKSIIGCTFAHSIKLDDSVDVMKLQEKYPCEIIKKDGSYWAIITQKMLLKEDKAELVKLHPEFKSVENISTTWEGGITFHNSVTGRLKNYEEDNGIPMDSK